MSRVTVAGFGHVKRTWVSRSAIVPALFALAVFAAVPSVGVCAVTVYNLHNHPDGNVNPPPYGMRLDELYNATSGHDIFTLNFDDVSSSMTLTYNDVANTIVIAGTSAGGRDVGGSYAADVYNGAYTVSFTYNLGVGVVPGDDDLWVDTANHSNFGSILTPLGDTVTLVDERGGNPYSFRLGDEDNDLGHRGFAGTSGWGWLSYYNPANGNIKHVESSDWLFTATPVPPPPPEGAPEPATFVIWSVLGLSAACMYRRRARRGPA